MKPLTLLVFLCLAGCANKPPEPIVRTVEVRTPVAVPCNPKLGPKPSYPDTDESLKAAPDIFAGVQLLLAGRQLRQAREKELEAGIAGCAG